MEAGLAELRSFVATLSAAHQQEIKELKRLHEEEKQTLIASLEEKKESRNGKNALTQLRKELKAEKERAKELEKRIADYEERLHLIHGLSDRDGIIETTPECSLPSVQEEPLAPPTEVHDQVAVNEEEEERVLPMCLSDRKSAAKSGKKPWTHEGSEWDGVSQPCEPGLDSEEFRQFLKRRRDERQNPPSYKYIEVVRNKEGRNKLDAHDCADCKAFYSALNGDRVAPACGNHCKTPLNLGDRMKKLGGRHRAAYKPPRTPTGFWNLDFPDSIERKKREAAEKQKDS